jgi:hypothetical protein
LRTFFVVLTIVAIALCRLITTTQAQREAIVAINDMGGGFAYASDYQPFDAGVISGIVWHGQVVRTNIPIGVGQLPCTVGRCQLELINPFHRCPKLSENRILSRAG